MNFLLYLLVIFLAMISNSFITFILITLRVGFSLCRQILNSDEYNEYEKVSAFRLKKKYCLSLFIDSLITIIITVVVFFLLKQYFTIYLCAFILFIVLSIGKTGKNNQDNLEEFNNSLKSNYPYTSNNIEKENE